MKNLPSSKKILFYLFLGFLVGSYIDKSDALLGINFYSIFDLVGAIFLNSLKMIVIPLIMAGLIYNISSFQSKDDLSSLGIRAITFYIATSFIAILVGITYVNIIQPGLLNGSGAANLVGLNSNQNLDSIINSQENFSLKNFLLSIFTGNIFYSIAGGNMLFIIIFSIFFGLAIRSSDIKSIKTIKSFWEGIYLIFLKLMNFILFFTPYAVFCLIAKAAVNFNADSYMVIINFFVTVSLALLTHALIVYPLILYFFKRNTYEHFLGMSSAVLFAFSSSSSVATIPVTTKCLVEKLKYDEKKVNFIVPIGATINMDGTALFECVAVIFIAQLYGVDLTYVDQFLIISLELITSIGVAGIPSASFVAIIVILSSVGLPFEAVGIILGTDRILDMLRTSVNVFGDSCCVSVIGK